MADRKPQYTAAEIKAGLLILTSIVLFGLFFAAVRGLRPEKELVQYHAFFNDVGGLHVGAAVR